MRRFIAALFAFALMASPAMATPPLFHGDVITSTTPMFDVRAYGAKCNWNGTTGTDDSSAIIAAVTAAKNTGGGRIFIPGLCATTQTITNQGSPDIVFVGLGADTAHTSTPWSPTSALVWTGAAGGTLVKLSASSGGARPGGDGFVDIALENPSCGAADGLVVDTVVQPRVDGLKFDCFSSHALAVQGTISVNDVGGTQHGIFTRLQFDNATNTGDAIYLFTSSHNTFEDLSINYKNGNGITCSFCDFNDFINVREVRGTGGTGYGVALQGSTAFSNRFYDISPGTGLIKAFSGSWNTVYNYDNGDNGYANPVIDAAGPSVSTTIATGFSAGTQTVTPGAMTNISVGSELRIDGGTTTQEDVVVTATTASTFTANFIFAHGNGVAVAGSPAASLLWFSDVESVNGLQATDIQIPYNHGNNFGYQSEAPSSVAYIGSDNANGVNSGININVPTGSAGIHMLVNGSGSGFQVDTNGDIFGGSLALQNILHNQGTSLPYIENDRGATNGINIGVPSGSTNGLRMLTNGTPNGFKVDASGNVSGTSISTTANSTVDNMGFLNGNDIESTGSNSMHINQYHGTGGVWLCAGNGGCNAYVTASGAFQGVHNACSSSSGLPCAGTVTCSISAATSCSVNATVPANAVCTATANSSDTTTGSEWIKMGALSTNTLPVTFNVSSSQSTTAAANLTCD